KRRRCRTRPESGRRARRSGRSWRMPSLGVRLTPPPGSAPLLIEIQCACSWTAVPGSIRRSYSTQLTQVLRPATSLRQKRPEPWPRPCGFEVDLFDDADLARELGDLVDLLLDESLELVAGQIQ